MSGSFFWRIGGFWSAWAGWYWLSEFGCWISRFSEFGWGISRSSGFGWRINLFSGTGCWISFRLLDSQTRVGKTEPIAWRFVGRSVWLLQVQVGQAQTLSRNLSRNVEVRVRGAETNWWRDWLKLLQIRARRDHPFSRNLRGPFAIFQVRIGRVGPVGRFFDRNVQSGSWRREFFDRAAGFWHPLLK